MKEAIVNKVVISSSGSLYNGKKVRALEVLCPHCGKTHTHGGGTVDQDIQDFAGHRSPHCPEGIPKNGYVLVIPNDVKVEYSK